MGLIATAVADPDPPAGGWGFELTAGCTYTLTQPYSENDPFPTPQDPDTGLPAITGSLTIHGNGATITRSPSAPRFRIFRVLNSGGDEAGNLTLNDLTISNGWVEESQGGALINEGGTVILNNVTVSGNRATEGGGLHNKEGTLILNGSTVSSNIATSSDPNDEPVGGGIFNEGGNQGGILTISNSTIANNEAKWSGGGVFNKEGALTIDQGSVIRNNRALGAVQVGEPGETGGGGVFSEVGTLTIHNSTIRDNETTADGAGVLNVKGVMTISGSTVSGNTAHSFGGGVLNYDYDLETDNATIMNSTISGNSAYIGGGVFNFETRMTIHNSTISGNQAAQGGGVLSYEESTLVLTYSTITANSGGGLLMFKDEKSVATVKGSIISGNSDGDVAALQEELTGVRYNSLGYNIVGTAGPNVFFPIEFGATGDQRGVTNPMLGPLASNGGPTLTHAVLAGSPALDKIPSGDCTNHLGSAVTRDQRGTSRPRGSGCEIGSFEAGPVPPADHFSLEVIIEGQGNVARSPSADFYPAGTTVTLTATPQDDWEFAGWSGDLTSTNNPVAITMNDHKFVTATFNVTGGAGCTNGVGNVAGLINAIEEANADPDLGASTITLVANCTYTLTEVHNVDETEDSGSNGLPVITGNVVINGNGATIERQSSELGTQEFRIFFVEESGSLTLNNVTVTGGDYSDAGGGIHNNGGTLTLNNTTLSGHYSGDAGGALYNNQGTVTINNSIITQNSGGDYAGGLKNLEGTLTITGSTISANESSDGGGGLYNEGGTVVFDSSTLADNHSADSSGMFNTASPPSEFHPEGKEGVLIIRNNSVISGNTSEDMGAGVKNYGPGAILTVENSTIENNTAGDGGGGLTNDGGQATVTNSRIRNNEAIGEGGGGVYNGPGGTLEIKNSTISGNKALSEPGGGLFNFDGIVTIENSTVSGNAANWGGGLANEADAEGGILTVVNTTVSGNIAGEGGGGVFNDKGGRLTLLFSTVTANQALARNSGGVLSYNDEDVGGMPRATVKGSIIAGNTGRLNGFTFPSDVAAMEDKNPYSSLGYNVIGTAGDYVSFEVEFNEEGDETNVGNAMLGALANNGGPTLTHAPLSGSPAVNRVLVAQCTDEAGFPIAKDQRGETRPQGNNCDAGSVEVIVPGAAFVEITNIPSSANVGGSFTPTYSTNSNGQTSTTSLTPNVCTVSGGVVNYVSNGTCTLQAHVTAGSHHQAASGDPQSFQITNRRASAAFHPTNPESSAQGGTKQYTLRITRLSGAQLGSAKISVPAGFTISSLPSPVTSSQSTTFNVSYDAGARTISVAAINNDNRLTGNGQYVDVTFTSTVTGDLGDHQFTTQVWANLAFSNNEFHLTTQPVVNVTPPGPVLPSTSISTVSGNGTYGGTATLTATLTSNGNPVSGATVKFKLDDDDDDDDDVVGEAVTNASGLATLSDVDLSGYNAGTHSGEVRASFAGNDSYQGSSGSGNLVVSKAAGSVSISNMPSSATVGGSFTPTYTTNSDGQTSTASQTPTICTVSSGVVSFVAGGTCTLRASVAEGTNHLAATGADQSVTTVAENNRKATAAFQPGNPDGAVIGTEKQFTLRITRTATILGSARISIPDGFTVSNLPSQVTSSQGFTWNVTQSGGTISLAAINTDNRISANNQWVEVEFTATATGTAPRQDEWTTRAWASINFGPANEFDITVQPLVDVVEAGNKAPGSVSINNIPSSGVVGGSFTPTYTKLGDGTPSTTVLPASAHICSVSNGVVSFDAAGTCQLQASITEGSFHEAATGPEQSFTVTSTNRVATAAFRPNNPDSAMLGSQKSYTVRITRVSGAQLGSARITIPTGFTVSNLPSQVTSSQGFTWNVSQSGPTISLVAINTDNRISANNQWVEVEFTATAPSGTADLGDHQWTTSAWAGLNFANNPFDVIAQPSVTLTEAVTHQLSVSKTGAGTGTVTSSPASIDCGQTCSAGFAEGTSVVLTATPGPDSTFNGWSGAGNNGVNNTRVVEMTQVRSVSAHFRANQTITFTSTPPSPAMIGTQYTPTATGGDSGNPVSFTVSGACSISSGVVTMTANGTCTVRANQAGNNDYNAAPQATQQVNVGPQATSVGGITATTSTFGGATTLSATVSPSGVSGSVAFYVAGSSTPASGTVSYNASTGAATLSNVTHGLNANTSGYSVRAVFISSSASHNGSEATNPTALVVNKASATVSINNLPTSAQTGGSFTPTYTTPSNGQASTVSHTTAICTVNPSTGAVSYVAAGTCHLQASVAEGTNHLAATGPVQSFAIAQAPPPEPVEIVFGSMTNANNGASTSLSIGRPSGVQAGHFLLAQVSWEKGEAAGVTAPAGWTLVNRTNSGGDIGSGIYYKVATTSEPTSYTWTFSQSVKAAGGILRYTGVSTTSPIVASSGSFGASNTLTANSVNAVERSVAVAFFSLKKKETSLSVPSGMTGRYYYESPQDVAMRAADERRASAGATGNKTSTSIHSDKWVAQLVTLRPAN